MFKKFLKISFVVFIVILVYAMGFVVGEKQGQTLSVNQDNVVDSKKIPDYLNKEFDPGLFTEIRDIIQNNYVDGPISETELFYGALAGQVSVLGDPYSVFFNPEVAKEFAQELDSEFEGIGAEIGVKKNILTVIAPLPGSPAELAGLRTGDMIYKIDGKETSELTLNEAVMLIRGAKDTKVVLTVVRGYDGDMEELTIEITRGTIHFDTVKSEMKDGNILYINVSQFNADTERLFDKIVADSLNKDIKGIVLDLRGNPGGFLDTAVSISGRWIKKGDVVVYEKFSETRKTPYRSDSRGEFATIPTVVLVNGGSASASEIVAGALQDYGLGIVVGTQTFGKGSVQQLLQLSDGSQVKITVAKWLTPKERIIDKEGVTPDIEVKTTAEDYNNDVDPQLEKALELLKQK